MLRALYPRVSHRSQNLRGMPQPTFLDFMHGAAQRELESARDFIEAAVIFYRELP